MVGGVVGGMTGGSFRGVTGGRGFTGGLELGLRGRHPVGVLGIPRI